VTSVRARAGLPECCPVTHPPAYANQDKPTTITVPLVCHPATPSSVPVQIDVSVDAGNRDAAPGWRLRFTLRCPIARLSIPAPQISGPADGLWRHTCFEAFVGTEHGSAYQEFNFSPSGQWAVYSFSAERLRDGQVENKLSRIAPWLNTTQRDDHTLELEAWLPAQALAAVPASGHLRIGLSAVIESRDGQLSYWALNHPRDQPDFHHADGRRCRLLHPSSTLPHNQHPAPTTP
jgi:hypothetical protein